MDMPRISLVLTVCILVMAPVQGMTEGMTGEKSASENMTPIDRGYGQGEACFGDQYEAEDDLKTGNEQAVMDALRLLLEPGS
jgi:hypothetical protein